MRTILTALLLVAGIAGAQAAPQSCDEFKDALDEAVGAVKLNADITYRVSEISSETEYLEGLGDARIAIGCRDGVLSQFSGSSYETDQSLFHKLNQAVLIAMGVEKSVRKAETIANRVRAAAAKAEGGMMWEEVRGFTVEVTHYPSGGEQFRVDPPSS